jgi:hypothetical protein
MQAKHQPQILPQEIYPEVSKLLGAAIDELPKSRDKQVRDNHLLLIKRSYEALSNDAQDQFDIRLCDLLLNKLDKALRGARSCLANQGANPEETYKTIDEGHRLLSLFISCSFPYSGFGFLGDTPKKVCDQMSHDFDKIYRGLLFTFERYGRPTINEPALNRTIDFCAAVLAAQRPLLLLGDVQRSEFDTKDLLDLAISQIARGKGRTLKIKLDSTRASQIYTDPNCLTLVLYNLLKNSVRATEGLESREISITVDNTCDQWCTVIKVKDNGKGIALDQLRDEITKIIEAPASDMNDEDVLKWLFDPRISMSNGGTGLGLHLVRTIIHDRLGGQVSISNRQEGGAEVLIRLPNESNQPLL